MLARSMSVENCIKKLKYLVEKKSDLKVMDMENNFHQIEHDLIYTLFQKDANIYILYGEDCNL